MPDIFISYAWLDNRRDITGVTHRVPNAIDHFLEVYKIETDLPDDKLRQVFFWDRESIEMGDSITARIESHVVECPVMLAFFSPSYFASRACLEEWRAFREAEAKAGQDAEGRSRKLLIPIEVKPVELHEIERIDEDSERWWSDVAGSGGRKREITSKELLDPNDTAPLATSIRELARKVRGHLDRQRGSSPERRSRPNVLRVSTPITEPSLATPAIAAELASRRSELRYNKLDPVCVIYAGGTVGMIRKADSDLIHADYEMAQGIDGLVQPLASRLSSLMFDIHFFRLASPIDSSNVTAKEWVHLATLIQEQMPNYQGFVILHGTNTLAYSASALSFLLSDVIAKPVILTGSEVPLSNVNTDAVHNVENAIRASAHQAYAGPILIPEVCVYWNNTLHRGNRVAKKVASDRSASFHTPNMPTPLATLANDKLDVDYAHISQLPEAVTNPAVPAPRIVDIADVDVSILFIYPQMDFDQINNQFEKPPDGLILLAYGSGNVPDDERFISMLRRLLDAGTVVANITQCPYGRVELKLFEHAAALFDLGVIDGYDMTLEAAYTKLLWCLAKYGPETRTQKGVQDSIKARFQENLAGEMSASIFTVHWPRETFTHTEQSHYWISDVGDFKRRFPRLDIAEAFVRIEGLRLPDGLDRAKVRLFYGAPPSTEEEGRWENLLAEFDRTMTAEEARKGVDKNLEVTHAFRKAFTNQDFQLSIGLQEAPGIEFKSLRLVVYTKGTQRRDAG